MVSNLRCSGRRALTAVVAVISVVTGVSSFSTQPSSIVATRPSTRLSALPTPERYDTTYNAKPPTYSKDTQLWTPSSETEDVPYGPWGSFLRGGPTPFVLRLLSADQYDQAVFKYMAQTSCSRSEAQGNMDAFFNNGADWAYQKSEEARGRPVIDYTTLKPKQAALVITWAVFVTPFLGRCGYLIAATDKGWGITLDDIFNF